jgi:NAD(P)-dependent dehydrogenase (short-subunit alcohol dehydrogenase family)
MSALRFDDRVVVLTGGGRGIGRQHALLLGRLGARVLVADAGTDLFGAGGDPGPAGSVAEHIVEGGGCAVAYTADLSTEAGARGAIDAALGTWGRLDAVVHNAGFTLGGREFEDDSLDRLEALLSVNTRAAFALASQAWPAMVRQKYGRLVFTSSSALHGLPRSIPYSTAKASLVGLTRGLAAEGAAHGIKVNGVEPVAATRMAENLAESEFRTWFLKKMRPELVSPIVAVLASESCPVNGEILVAGGGRFARTIFGETPGWIEGNPTPDSVLKNLETITDDSRVEVITDGVHASAYHAELLGFKPTGPIVVTAGGAPAGPTN